MHKYKSLPLWQRNLIPISIAQILCILSFQASIILIPYYVQQMGMTDPAQVSRWTGMYQSIGSISFAIATPIWGALGDRYGRRPMLVRATVSTAIMLLLMGFARTPTELLVLRGIQGCVTGTPAAASALLATGTPKNRLAYALGLQQTALFVGTSIGPMIGGFVGDGYGYRSTFFVSAAIVAVALILVLALVVEPEESAANSAQARKRSAAKGFIELLSSPAMIALVLMSFAVNFTFGLTGPVMPLFIQSLVGESERIASIAGTVTGIAAITAAVSALVVGRLSDKWGNRIALMGCSAGAALLYVPQAAARSVWQLGAALTAQGLFRGGIAPNISAMVVRSVPKEQTGSALGLTTSFQSAGFAVGPLIGAAIMGASSGRTVFLVAGGVFALVAIGTVFFRPPEPNADR
ncbi:MAG: multidrug efflux MFS transporter [Chloroflexi bacterium]|nr:multidrug efflux MFS transporter [Chloroflexota bacterium]